MASPPAPPPPAFPLLVEVAPARPAGGADNASPPAAGPTYRVSYAPRGVQRPPGVDTCFELFRESALRFAERPCLGHRPPLAPDAGGAGGAAGGASAHGPYEWLTYQQAYEAAGKVASALLHLGLRPKDRVGVFGANCPEWMLAMQGCNRTSLECVPLYDTLGDSAVGYVMDHSGTRFVASAGDKLAALAKALSSETYAGGPLVGVAYWGDAPAGAVDAVAKAAGDGARVLAWAELLALGEQHPRDPVPPAADDVCTIMYTSGTTGNPKGVVHTHGGVVSCVAAMRVFLDNNNLHVGHDDVYLSFLTLAHIFDRVVEEMALFVGASVGYVVSTRTIMDDAQVLKPTLFAAVPRVYERVYGGVSDKVAKAGRLAGLAFHSALAYKRFWMKRGYTTESASPLANRLLFSNTKAALGGRVRVMISGGAPLPAYASEFMELAMVVPVLQGYGLTESCAASFVQQPHNHGQIGTVGPPMPGVDFRLEAVPELGHSPDGRPPRGELCIRGPAQFVAYYKQPELTAEAVDADGFFHTGDIGELAPSGALKIVDRKKNIFKLSQGEYVAVEFLESVFGKCDAVEQLWLHGSSFESCLVAVVVPAKKKLLAWAQGAQGGLAALPFERLCEAEAARAHVLAALTATGKEARLKGFEFPKALRLEPHAWTVEAQLITPKLSLKRPQLLKHYQRQVDEMYAALKAKGAGAGAGAGAAGGASGAAKKGGGGTSGSAGAAAAAPAAATAPAPA